MIANLNSTAKHHSQSGSVVLRWPPSMHWVNEQFFEFCQANKELRIERNRRGECEIMAPTGGETSWRNSSLIAQLYNWAETEGSGVVFDSSGGFLLPNGAIRSPDVSWVEKTRLAALTPKQKQRFLPLCPDFVIELLSPSDNLQALQDKMREYIENGTRLAWLIDAQIKRAYVFRTEAEVSILDNPEYLSGDAVLIGFRLDMEKIWSVEF